MTRTVLIVTTNRELSGIIDKILGTNYTKLHLSAFESIVESALSVMPSLVIADISDPGDTKRHILSSVKKDPIFHQMPVLAIAHDDQPADTLCDLLIEDYILRSTLERELLSRVEFCIHRQERTAEINPLTRLPGNISINRHIQERLDSGERFALAYADLDNFKPFNDTYGFSRGDDVIKMTGRIIYNIVKITQPSCSFVGHIGGDDFIYIMDIGQIIRATRDIISTFDEIIPAFYNDNDRVSGCIRAINRREIIETFPLITLSVGIASNQYRPFSHYGEISEIATELKKYAKQTRGSCYKFDQRTGRSPAGTRSVEALR